MILTKSPNKELISSCFLSPLMTTPNDILRNQYNGGSVVQKKSSISWVSIKARIQLRQ
jgi:hypothetical protein